MSPVQARSSARLLLPLSAILVAIGACGPVDPIPVELRGVWLTNVDSEVLDSRAAIAEAMQFLSDHHFNVVYPVVWNGGYTLYPSALMDSVFGTPIDPRFAGRDPLAKLVEEADRHGIAVIPWFEFGFASSYRDEGGHLLAAKPHWAARDSAGGLLTKNGFEWMNAYHPEVQQFLLDLVVEVVSTYPVDGVQGDDRMPAQPSEGGYSAFTDSLYRAAHDGAAPPPNPQDAEWLRWRADRLNTFSRRLHDAVKGVDAALQVSWSPSIYPWSYQQYLQDWPEWLREGYADQVHPQVYRYGLDAYRSALLSQLPDSIGVAQEQIEKIFPGILIKVGDYRIDPGDLEASIGANRDAGFRGEVLFFYEGLREADGELARRLLATHYASPAQLPFPLRN